MGSFSLWHWLIVLVVVVLVFGTKKLRGAGGDLGAAVKNFKQSMNEGEADSARKPDAVSQQPTHVSQDESHKDKV